jgi:hypothetical protein
MRQAAYANAHLRIHAGGVSTDEVVDRILAAMDTEGRL